MSLTISPVRDDDGNVIGASKMVRDIMRERVAEAEREKFVTLVETSTDFIGICDLQGVPSFVNRAGLAMVGLDSMEQARRVPVGDFFFPEDRPKMIERFLPARFWSRATARSKCASATSRPAKRAGWPTRC